MNDQLEIIYGPRDDEFEGEEGGGDYDRFVDWYADYDKIRKESVYAKTLLFEEKSYAEQQEEGSIKTVISSTSSVDFSVLSKSTLSKLTLAEHVHPCLQTVTISDSQLKFFDLYAFFPIPPDPGIDRAFWLLYPPLPEYPDDGVAKFFDLANAMELPPIDSLKYQLRSHEVNLRFYSIDPDILKPLGQALKFNKTVETLDLQDNYLTPESCFYLDKLLLRSIHLKYLNLTGCKIGPEGAARLENGITMSTSLRRLNLSRCDIGNEGFEFISRAVALNSLLRKLDLSDNNLDQDSTLNLKKMLKGNTSLEYLNLSWNNFNTKDTAVIIFSTLVDHPDLIDINLSWNSLGQETVNPLCVFMANSKKIKHLNIEANRYSDQALGPFTKALLQSRSLEELKLDGNPLSSIKISEFIKSLEVKEFSKTSMKLIDFGNLYATKECKETLEKLKQIKPNFKVVLGGILGNFTIVGPDLKELFFSAANFEAMKPKRKKERKNFGEFLMSLPDNPIKKDKFAEIVEAAEIKVSSNLVNEIRKLFMVNKRIMDTKAMKESYLKYFPNTKIPKPKDPEIEIPQAGAKEKNEKKDKKGKKTKAKKKK